MEKTLEFVTQSMGLLIITILSFMLGFNVSYKYNHIHEFIDFLLKCYVWFIDWFLTYLVSFTLYFKGQPLISSQYDETVTQIFAGFVFFYGLFVLLETVIFTLWKGLISHSTKRS